MIKEMYKLFMGGMMILALSCKGTNSDVSESKDILLEVDNVGEGLLLSEEFTDVEIIPLENNPKAILSDVRKMIVTDRGMYYIFYRQDQSERCREVLAWHGRHPDGRHCKERCQRR